MTREEIYDVAMKDYEEEVAEAKKNYKQVCPNCGALFSEDEGYSFKLQHCKIAVCTKCGKEYAEYLAKHKEE